MKYSIRMRHSEASFSKLKGKDNIKFPCVAGHRDCVAGYGSLHSGRASFDSYFELIIMSDEEITTQTIS